jgi:hypothetical protein
MPSNQKFIIDKKYKNALDLAKKEIEKRRNEQENLYLAWCSALSVSKSSPEAKLLSDYMFDGKNTIGFK